MSKQREIHLEERPKSFKEVIGQRDACAQLVSMAKGADGLPHCILFTGPSGCGKTTLARIVRRKLRCSDNDFCEVNAAESRGIDMVRSIQRRVGLAPIGGDARVWLVDECHQLTADAQGAFLKLLEEPPDHVYFMLATTHPEKLRKAIKTRCAEIKVSVLSERNIKKLILGVANRRGAVMFDSVIHSIVALSEGSARKALVLLHQVIGIEDEDQQINILQKADSNAVAIDIARALMAGSWKKLAALLKQCDEEPERIRWFILSYFTTVALSGGRNDKRAVQIIDEFQDNYFDSKKAGLVASCYRACN